MTYSTSERLYIFESPIDAMSHASLVNYESGDTDAWRSHNRLSLSGISDAALSKYLEMYPHIKELVFYLDNDPAGRDAAVAMKRMYADKGYFSRMELPAKKDVNEDLMDLRVKIRLKNAQKTTIKTRDDICV
jgi:hypothetical protein